MKATPGDTVLYRLTDTDADLIQESRADADLPARGNLANPGDYYPAMVVRDFGGDTVNLQVFLDGPDTYWATSRKEGTVPGTWAWPLGADETDSDAPKPETMGNTHEVDERYVPPGYQPAHAEASER